MPKKKKDVKVENNPGLIRDTATSAIINTNSNAYEARREQIARDRNQNRLINCNEMISITLNLMLLKLKEC